MTKHTHTSRSGDLKDRSGEVRSELWTALIGNDQSHKNLLAHIEALQAENERLREELAAAYVDQSGTVQHASDCATSNAPAMKPGPCDCAALGEK